MQRKVAESPKQEETGIIWKVGFGVLIILFFTMQYIYSSMMPEFSQYQHQEQRTASKSVESKKSVNFVGIGELPDFSGIVFSWINSDKIETAQKPD